MRRTHGKPPHLFADRVEFGRAVNAPKTRETLQDGQRDVVPHAHQRDDTVTLAVFRHHRNARTNGV